jgi:hypothetical protein
VLFLVKKFIFQLQAGIFFLFHWYHVQFFATRENSSFRKRPETDRFCALANPFAAKQNELWPGKNTTQRPMHTGRHVNSGHMGSAK